MKIVNNYNMHFETGSNPTIFNNAKIEVHGDLITTPVKRKKTRNQKMGNRSYSENFER